MIYLIRGMRVINHPHPLLLVGADVLCGGRSPPMWNFNGVHQKTLGGNVCEGALVFEKGDDVV